MVKLSSYLPSTDVISADRLEMKNGVISSWSSEVRILPLDVVVQTDHVDAVGLVLRGDEDVEVSGWSEEGYSWLLTTVSTAVSNGPGDQYAVDLVDDDAEAGDWSEEGYSWTPGYSFYYDV